MWLRAFAKSVMVSVYTVVKCVGKQPSAGRIRVSDLACGDIQLCHVETTAPQLKWAKNVKLDLRVKHYVFRSKWDQR